MDYRIGLQFAEAAHAKADLLSSLGIDWTSLIIQTIAFLILLVVLYKFVYPPLTKALDKRDADLKLAANAARDAKRQMAEAEERAAQLVRQAREDAASVVATSRDEAAQLLAQTEERARRKAEALLDSAKIDIAREVEDARTALRAEAVELVASATGVVLQEKIDAKKDADLITRALTEVQ